MGSSSVNRQNALYESENNGAKKYMPEQFTVLRMPPDSNLKFQNWPSEEYMDFERIQRYIISCCGSPRKFPEELIEIRKLMYSIIKKVKILDYHGFCVKRNFSFSDNVILKMRKNGESLSYLPFPEQKKILGDFKTLLEQYDQHLKAAVESQNLNNDGFQNIESLDWNGFNNIVKKLDETLEYLRDDSISSDVSREVRWELIDGIEKFKELMSGIKELVGRADELKIKVDRNFTFDQIYGDYFENFNPKSFSNLMSMRTSLRNNSSMHLLSFYHSQLVEEIKKVDPDFIKAFRSNIRL